MVDVKLFSAYYFRSLSRFLEKNNLQFTNFALWLAIYKVRPNSMMANRKLGESLRSLSPELQSKVRQIIAKSPVGKKILQAKEYEEDLEDGKIQIEHVIESGMIQYFNDNIQESLTKYYFDQLLSDEVYSKDRKTALENTNSILITREKDCDYILESIKNIDKEVCELFDKADKNSNLSRIKFQLDILRLLNKKLIPHGEYLQLSFTNLSNFRKIIQNQKDDVKKQKTLNSFLFLAKDAHEFAFWREGMDHCKNNDPELFWSMAVKILKPPTRAATQYSGYIENDIRSLEKTAIQIIKANQNPALVRQCFVFLSLLSPDGEVVELAENLLTKIRNGKSLGHSKKLSEKIQLVTCFEKVASNKVQDQALKLLEKINHKKPQIPLTKALLNHYIKRGMFRKGLNLIDNNSDHTNSSYFNEKRSYLERNLGQLRESQESINKALHQSILHLLRYNNYSLLLNIESALFKAEEVRFLVETEKIFSRSENTDKNQGYLFFVAPDVKTYRRFPFLAFKELQKSGTSVYSLNSGVQTRTEETMKDELGTIVDSISLGNSCLNKSEKLHDLYHDWQVDWDRKEVICEGVNYYQGIFERLSIFNRRITLDITKYPVKNQFDNLIHHCDRFLTVIKRIRKFSQEQNKAVKVVFIDTLAAPYSVFRQYLKQNGYENESIDIIHISIAYENYYSNLSTMISKRLAVGNVSRDYERRIPFLPQKDKFFSWVEENRESLANLRNDSLKYIRQNRVYSDAQNSERLALIDRLTDERAKGKTIVGMIGKVVCDLGLPTDGGPIFRDIQQWVDYMVEFARRENVIVLVKPHPHELRKEIGLYLTEQLRDLFPKELPENMIFLDHSMFNTYELSDIIDAAIIWNGSACLELGVLKTPTILCSQFGHYDYPLGHLNPNTKEEYDKILKTKKSDYGDESLEETSLLCGAYLSYMKTDEVSIPYGYVNRPATNIDTWPPKWIPEELSRFNKEGDPHVDVITDIIRN